MLTGWRPGVVDCGGGVFASCLPRVQLFVSACNGRPHIALQHHWLLPVNCHFDDCKARLVRFSCKTRYIRIPGFSFLAYKSYIFGKFDLDLWPLTLRAKIDISAQVCVREHTIITCHLLSTDRSDWGDPEASYSHYLSSDNVCAILGAVAVCWASVSFR